MRRLLLAVPLVLACAACPPPPAGHDAGPEADAGPPADSGAPADAGYDAGPADAGVDAGPVDAGDPCARTMDWSPRPFGGPAVYVSAAASRDGGTGTQADPYGDLQRAIDAAPDGAVLRLSAGNYAATATPYVDPACANCAVGSTKTPAATRGFIIKDKRFLAIEGAGPGSTTLITNAGYGVFVEDACEVHLLEVAVTGGKRDPDGDASNGAVFARRARVVLNNVTITNNLELLPGNSYPGIIGVVCREDSDVLVLGCTITDNSWDGVAVYKQGRVRVFASRIARGKGVGVGVTFDGKAQVVSSDISYYWKGIGAFVDARVEARNNTVHEQLGWGLWAAGRGYLDAVNNTVAYNDQLGVFLGDPETTGRFVNNVVAFNGLDRWKSYPAATFGQGGIRGPAGAANPFAPAHNVLFGNRTVDWLGTDGGTPAVEWGSTNLNVDPKFAGEYALRPSAGSPLVDSGDPAILDKDGSRSDVGATGGPDYGRTRP